MGEWQSDNVQDLAAAIAKAQSRMKPAVKDSANPFFKSKYADLSSVWAALQPFMEEGIAITQSPMPAESGVMIDTQLTHASGQWMRSRLVMPVGKNDPQGIGSAITYARRYALGCMTGLVTEEDDDGNAAQQSHRPAPHHKPAITKKPEGAAPLPPGGAGQSSAGDGPSPAGAPPKPETTIFDETAIMADHEAAIEAAVDMPSIQRAWDEVTKDQRISNKGPLYKKYQAKLKALKGAK